MCTGYSMHYSLSIMQLFTASKRQTASSNVDRVGGGIAPRLEHMFLLAGYFK